MSYNKNSVIIVGGDHHNTLGLIRAFGYQGYYVIAYIIDQRSKSFVVHSKYVNEFQIFKTEEEVLKVLLQRDASVMIPIVASSDKAAEVLDNSFNSLSQKYYLANCNGQGNLSFWMNKENMLRRATECGLHPPYSMFVRHNTPIDIRLQDIPLPCIIKPLKSSGSSKDDFAVCTDYQELIKTVNAKRYSKEEFIIQEKINIDYEFLIIGSRCRRTKANHIVGGLHKIKCCKDVDNMGMLVQAYTTPIIPSIIELSSITAFLESIDYEGLYSIEFMVAGEIAYFTEINLRNDGCIWCWTEAGCNIAANWADEIKGNDNVVYNPLENKMMVVEISYLKYYRDNLYSMLRDFIQADAFAIYNRRDIKPLVYKFLYAI